VFSVLHRVDMQSYRAILQCEAYMQRLCKGWCITSIKILSSLLRLTIKTNPTEFLQVCGVSLVD